MVAFGILPQHFGRQWGRTSGSLSFYKCRFSGGTLEPYHVHKNLLERFAFIGSGNTKTSGSSAGVQEH